MRYDTVIAEFTDGRYVQTRHLYTGDYGIKLDIRGVELPSPFFCDICNEGDRTAETFEETAQIVKIPEKFLQSGKDIIVYLVTSGERTRQTVGKIRIPVIRIAKF